MRYNKQIIDLNLKSEDMIVYKEGELREVIYLRTVSSYRAIRY